MIKLLKGSVVLLIATLLVACASGSSVITGKVRAPIDPSRVQIYSEKPEGSDVIGIVSASSDAGWTEQGSLDYAMQELKSRAAKIGANGVLIENVGTATSGFIMAGNVAIPVSAKTISGKAIFVEGRTK